LGQTVALLAVIEPSPLVTAHKISTLFEASRYFLSLLGPRFWPYIQDYFHLLTAAESAKRAGSDAVLGRYRQPELARLWQVVRANVQASHHYKAQNYPGQIILFQTEQNHQAGQAVRWQQLAAGGLELHHLSGHHLNILRQPYVAELASQLAACLEQAHHKGREK
jgi:thioesterase domain-containing protein